MRKRRYFSTQNVVRESMGRNKWHDFPDAEIMKYARTNPVSPDIQGEYDRISQEYADEVNNLLQTYAPESGSDWQEDAAEDYTAAMGVLYGDYENRLTRIIYTSTDVENPTGRSSTEFDRLLTRRYAAYVATMAVEELREYPENHPDPVRLDAKKLHDPDNIKEFIEMYKGTKIKESRSPLRRSRLRESVSDFDVLEFAKSKIVNHATAEFQNIYARYARDYKKQVDDIIDEHNPEWRDHWQDSVNDEYGSYGSDILGLLQDFEHRLMHDIYQAMDLGQHDHKKNIRNIGWQFAKYVTTMAVMKLEHYIDGEDSDLNLIVSDLHNPDNIKEFIEIYKNTKIKESRRRNGGRSLREANDAYADVDPKAFTRHVFVGLENLKNEVTEFANMIDNYLSNNYNAFDKDDYSAVVRTFNRLTTIESIIEKELQDEVTYQVQESRDEVSAYCTACGEPMDMKDIDSESTSDVRGTWKIGGRVGECPVCGNDKARVNRGGIPITDHGTLRQVQGSIPESRNAVRIARDRRSRRENTALSEYHTPTEQLRGLIDGLERIGESRRGRKLNETSRNAPPSYDDMSWEIAASVVSYFIDDPESEDEKFLSNVIRKHSDASVDVYNWPAPESVDWDKVAQEVIEQYMRRSGEVVSDVEPNIAKYVGSILNAEYRFMAGYSE